MGSSGSEWEHPVQVRGRPMTAGSTASWPSRLHGMLGARDATAGQRAVRTGWLAAASPRGGPATSIVKIVRFLLDLPMERPRLPPEVVMCHVRLGLLLVLAAACN